LKACALVVCSVSALSGAACSSSSSNDSAADAGTDATPPDGRLEGAAVDMFGGSVKTWATISGGLVTEVGVTLPMATIAGAPAARTPASPPAPSAPTRELLDFPAVVAATTFVNHFELDWNALGHEPAFYGAPHFDLHFYRPSRAEMEALDCTDGSRPPESAVPPGYSLPPPGFPGVCVPQMGVHASPAGDDSPTSSWKQSMIFGYYGEKFIFVEPMITKETLEAKRSFTLPLPAPASIGGAATRYPTKFEARYDEAKSQYDMVLSSFQLLN
jgi:hypothetical protein